VIQPKGLDISTSDTAPEGATTPPEPSSAPSPTNPFGTPLHAEPAAAPVQSPAPVTPPTAPAYEPTAPVEPAAAPFEPTVPVSAPAEPAAPAAPAAAPFESAPAPAASAGWAPPTAPTAPADPLAPGATAPVDATAPIAPGFPPPVVDPALAPPEKKKRKWGWIIAVILLALGLITVGIILILSLIRLGEAQELIGDQKEQIQEQEDVIEEKESFSSAMNELMATAHLFDGLPYGDIVPIDRYQNLATGAWEHRWDPATVALDTVEVQAETADLNAILTAAQEQAATNVSGTNYEAVVDQLGTGYVTSAFDDPDTLCESDVLGCVMWDDPYTIHFDQADGYHESMNDWIRTGVAYHEYAHVLQGTNLYETDLAAEAFGGDYETMADCYVFTYLPGWTLDHTVFVGDGSYWEVSVGYGYTCNESQRQSIRDWVASIGVQVEAITQ
jgi:hypothetical protein